MPKSHPDKDRAMPLSPSVLDNAVPGHDQPGGAQDPAIVARAGEEGSMPELGAVSAVIEDGLLMIFGPDGDPVPPEAFRAAADDQPEALVRLGGDERVSAARIAAVLEAQRAGRLVPGEGEGSGWIAAMLGLGPQPASAIPDELEAEERLSQSVDLPGRMRLGPDGVLDLGCLAAAAERMAATSVEIAGLPSAAMLSAGHDQGGGTWHLVPNELAGLVLFAIPEALADFTLSITMASQDAQRTGAIAIARTDRPEAPAPNANLPARADSSLPPPPPEQAGDRDEEPVPAVVIVAGLPEGAVLSAGADNGNGSWSIPVEEVPGLALTLPPGQASALKLTVSVVSIAGRDGALAVRAQQIAVLPGGPLRLDLPTGTAPSAAMRALPLGISGLVGELAEGGRVDAVALSGLPDGIALSAGIHDQRTGCWIVRPDQLASLEVRAAHGARSRFVLRLTAMTIDRTSGKPSARSRRLRIDLASLAPRMAQDRPVRPGGVGFFRPLGCRRRLA